MTPAEKFAKRKALEWFNTQRSMKGETPVRALHPVYWQMNKSYWMEKTAGMEVHVYDVARNSKVSATVTAIDPEKCKITVIEDELKKEHIFVNFPPGVIVGQKVFVQWHFWGCFLVYA